jgi:hypothetical protein
MTVTRRPTFFEGVGVALASSVVAAISFAALAQILPGALALRLVVAGVGLAYVLYLLSRARARVGRVTAASAWAAVTLAVGLTDPPLSIHVLAQLAMVWLIRSLYFHSSVLAALADLVLCAFGLAAAVWAAAQSASVFLSVWCLLLVQALFAAIPTHPRGVTSRPGAHPDQDDAFARAYRNAQCAVRRLSITP